MKLSEIFASNLRGHEYLKARGLSPQVIRDQQHTCDSCRKLEMLPVVQQITERWRVTSKNKMRLIK